MSKVDIGENVFVYPNPVTLLGTEIDGIANFMPLGWVSRVNANPPLIGIGVNRANHTHSGIRKHLEFSINYPKTGMIQKVDYCGMVSGKRQDKSGIFTSFSGKLKHAPMIEECTLCLECRVTDVLENESNYFFVGQIMGAYCDEGCLTDGNPDIEKMDPLLLTMPDNRYWKIGEYAGKAWSIGKEFSPK